MLRFLQQTCLALAIAGAANSASAFSLLGPFAVDQAGAIWQTAALGYNPPTPRNNSSYVDIGGPLNLGEEYRWNMKTVTYGFDESFRNYFGERGMEEIRKVFAILNSIPPVSKMSSNLTEFPTDARRVNYQASALGLLDLKSETLAIMMEELGLAGPERYTWTLHGRDTLTGGALSYFVIKRNFDPITFEPSSYVNGSLYTYAIQELVNPAWTDAAEIPVDPLAFSFTSVAGAGEPEQQTGAGGLLTGQFFTGLTRDDVGGLRYLLRQNNYNIEGLLTNVTGSGGGSPWTPAGGAGTLVNVALRGGVDKIKFEEGKYDSQFGGFIAITNTYKDTYVTNSHLFTQTIQRGLTQPDIVFAASDFGDNGAGGPNGLLSRTDTTGWANNDLINGQTTLGGPGVIQPQVVITYNKVGPSYNNFSSTLVSYLNEYNAYKFTYWGSFDGTTNEPVIYPSGTSIRDVERLVLGGH